MDSKFNPIVKIPFHEGAGKLALLAIQAESEGKFWAVNDALYMQARETNVIDVMAISENLGMEKAISMGSLYSKEYLHRLQRDISDGLKLGISGTPSFVIDGKVYASQIPPDILAHIVK